MGRHARKMTHHEVHYLIRCACRAVIDDCGCVKKPAPEVLPSCIHNKSANELFAELLKASTTWQVPAPWFMYVIRQMARITQKHPEAIFLEWKGAHYERTGQRELPIT